MKTLVYLKFFSLISSILAGTCIRKYHFWRPFVGEHGPHDYLVGRDLSGKQNYVGKMIPAYDTRSWTISTQIIHDYAEIAFEDKRVRRIDRFLEILSVEPQYQEKFFWVFVDSERDLRNLPHRLGSCLVEGGIFKYQDRTIYSYIGSVSINGSIHIGPVFVDNWALRSGLHFLNGWETRYRQRAFTVLAQYY
ncbi:uncharacterized protein LOC123678895 [Harmonia axyridis]|uniref:uncharacterized protein LOC123678895 n=1 Tax=Harmonia axyridis TaxID=115357 RepID=UPI001E275A97|nr:uncharacterized protein LOC123678895 [Harmonia axyridis]